MRRVGLAVMGIGLVLGMMNAWAAEEHDHAAAGANKEQVLTGEVVDVFCYLSHGQEALGKGHADCAKKCITNGLPVAIKVGNQLYLAAMGSHDPANTMLADAAGEQVTVHGTVLERDGQHLISITKVEDAR